MEILGWISRLSAGGHFHMLLVRLNPQPASERKAQRAMKYVPECVQKIHRHGPVENLEVAFIQRPQSHPFVGALGGR